MRFGRSKSKTRYMSMMGFTQVLMSLIALALLGVGIFDYINPEVLSFGNASYVMMVLGGMILVVTTMFGLTQMFQFSDNRAWIASLSFVILVAVAILMVSMIYEGGIGIG